KATSGTRNWTIEELRTAYAELENPVLSTRLLALLNWADERHCVAPGEATQNPLFSVVGRTGYWIVQVAPRWIYPRLQLMRWESVIERDAFVSDLKQINLYPADFDPASTKDGKNTRKLEEWSDAQFAAFLEILAKYCKPQA